MDRTEEEMSVSISAVGAVAYVCCTVTFVLLVCLLFFLGLTPTQRYARATQYHSAKVRPCNGSTQYHGAVCEL